jgi:DNA-directed RNA polymerase beta' subunit
LLQLVPINIEISFKPIFLQVAEYSLKSHKISLLSVYLCWSKGHIPFNDLRNSLKQETFITKPFLVKQEHVVSRCKIAWCFSGLNGSGKVKENLARSEERRKDLSLRDNCVLSVQNRKNWSILDNLPILKKRP